MGGGNTNYLGRIVDLGILFHSMKLEALESMEEIEKLR
jgi:hypothetical protein